MHKEKEKEFPKLTKIHKNYVNAPSLSRLNMKEREADIHQLTLNREEVGNKGSHLFKRKPDLF